MSECTLTTNVFNSATFFVRSRYCKDVHFSCLLSCSPFRYNQREIKQTTLPRSVLQHRWDLTNIWSQSITTFCSQQVHLIKDAHLWSPERSQTSPSGPISSLWYNLTIWGCEGSLPPPRCPDAQLPKLPLTATDVSSLYGSIYGSLHGSPYITQ